MFKKIALSVVFATMLTLSLFNSQATAASTVSFCIEVSCSSMTVTFGGVTHPKTLNCDNMLSFDGASPGTYSYSVSGCGLTSSGSVTVDGTSSYSITICPPSGWPCCPIGCGTGGDYKCSCSGTTTTTTTSTTTTTTSTSNTTTTTLPTVLTEPTLTVTTSGTTVSLSWTSVAGATGYTLYYAPYPYTGPDSIENIPMGTQTSISASLWEGAAFYVAVQAYVSGKSSGYSNIEYFIIQIQTEPAFMVMTNPTDSQLLSVKGSDGTTVHYYGDRDDSGIPTNIDRLSVVGADGTTTMIELDSESRPKRMRSHDGVVFEISYVGDDQGVVTAIVADGSEQVTTTFPIGKVASRPSPVEPLPRVSENSDADDIRIKLDRCGAAVTDALVNVYIGSADPLAIFNTWRGTAKHDGDGIYRLSLPSSLRPPLNSEDIKKAAEKIAYVLGLACTALSLGDPIAAVSAPMLLGGMCIGLGALTGPFGPGIVVSCNAVCAATLAYCLVPGNGGYVPGADSFAERIIKGIQIPNDWSGTLTINARVWIPGLYGGPDSATATAPAIGPFPMIEIAVPDRFISSLTFSPMIPAALQPYDLITEIGCPEKGDYLTIDVVREDDREVPLKYHFQFPPIYDGITTKLTKAIPPGGDFGAAKDTVTATLSTHYGGTVHSRPAVIEIPAAVPTITDISPNMGSVYTIVTITGTGFGKTQGYVLFNGTPTGEYGLWTDTEIQTVVPFGATSGNVIVRDAAGTNSNGVYFVVFDINGTWTGTFTFTDFEITDESAAEEEGCTPVNAQELIGKPLPMTIEITVDEIGQGTATMLIDGSLFGESEDRPQSFTVIQNGSAVTFEPTVTGLSGLRTMNATVTPKGTRLSMKGRTFASGLGWKMNAAFTVGKPQ